MINFLFKGIIRDRSRSFFPLLIIATGVMLTVFAYSWLNGILNDLFDSNAKLHTGHVKITTIAYDREANQLPNDLALVQVDSLISACQENFPSMVWLARIRFGGLLDIPDENLETKAKGPVLGIAAELLTENSPEAKILNLQTALVEGRLPQQNGEILIARDFAEKLGVKLNDVATLISTTMYGSMSMYNFTIVGTVHFGINAMDRSAIITDISDIRLALDMADAASEILGFFENYQYSLKDADEIAQVFNAKFSEPEDEFSPVMHSLKQQNGLAEMIEIITAALTIVVGIFIFVMFVVLWNAGLMGSIRRFGEIGVRLAIGEDKGHLYRSMLYESVILGLIGSVIGTAVGLGFSYYMQDVGIDMGSTLRNSSILMNNVYRARITQVSYFIGFIPGLVATFLGTAASGIGIYKRQTSQLFKELEV